MIVSLDNVKHGQRTRWLAPRPVCVEEHDACIGSLGTVRVLWSATRAILSVVEVHQGETEFQFCLGITTYTSHSTEPTYIGSFLESLMTRSVSQAAKGHSRRDRVKSSKVRCRELTRLARIRGGFGIVRLRTLAGGRDTRPVSLR